MNKYEPLVQLSRQTLEMYSKTGDTPKQDPKLEILNEKRGCFVTLFKHHELRGCVGTFSEEETLFENITRMTIAAATRDTRFVPVQKAELSTIQIEISVLGPLEKVGAFEEIEIGKHGVYIKLGDQSGTYLPQVAVDQGWNTVEFITHCAREKVGLKPEECSRAEVYRYEVSKVSE